MANCKRCGAAIRYCQTIKGRSMPVDPGKVAIVTKRGCVVHGWVSHFCTCDSRVRCLPEESRILQRRFVFP